MWLGLHAEVRHPDDPDRILLLAVKVADLTPEGTGRVTLNGVPQSDVTFEEALVMELNRALAQVDQGVAEIELGAR